MDTSKSNILSKLDEQIAPNDFVERLCLVNIVVAAYQLWPALKYNSYNELKDQIKDKTLRGKITVEYSKLCRASKVNKDEYGIAYLLGRDKSQSALVFVPKNSEGVVVEDNISVFDFCHHVGEIERAVDGEGYCGSAQFQAAYTLAINRTDQYFAMNDEKEELEKTSTPSAPGDIDVSGGGTDTEKAESDVDESFSAQATVCSQMISPSDVEGSAALQLGITHPSKPNQKNCRKRKHITPSPRSRNTNVCKRREKESSDTKGGSTLVVNKLPPLKATFVSAATDTATSNCTKGHIANNRTCLLDAIAVHVPIKVKEEVSSSVYSSMPSEGDTSINDANRGLAKHGMTLKRVSGYYIKKGGAPLHLLQIQEQCRIVIRIKLVTLENEVANHFVAWDGSTVFDRPKNAEVNRTSDRSSKKSCNAVFERLYPKNQFLSWQITNVYELCYL